MLGRFRQALRWPWDRGGRIPNALAVALLLLASGVGILGAASRPPLACAATPEPLTNFCYSFRVTITNATAGALNDRAVSFTVNSDSLTDNQFLDLNGLAMRMIDHNGQVAHLFSQDLTSTTARWWVLVNTIPASTSLTYTIYLGSLTAKRNNGAIFNGSATTDITRADEAWMDLTDNFWIEVIAETSEVVGTFAAFTPLASHFDTGTNLGWRLGVIDVAGTRFVRAQVDTGTVDYAWPGSGELRTFRMDYRDPNLIIYADGVNVASAALAVGPAGANAQTLISGRSFIGAIRLVEITDSITTTPTRLMRWGIHALQAAAGASVPPNFPSNIDDETANNRDGTYNINDAQTDFTTSVGNVANNFTDASVTFSARAVNNIVGTPFPVNINATPAASAGNTLPLGRRINVLANDTDFGVDNQTVWLVVAITLSVIGMLVTGFVGRTALLALVPPVFVFLAFAAVGVLSYWIPVVLGLAIVGFYGLTKLGRQGA